MTLCKYSDSSPMESKRLMPLTVEQMVPSRTSVEAALHTG
jgi:hypothetical protein